MSNGEWLLSGFGDEIAEDPHVQISVLQALGANFIEVRSAWGINIVDLDTADLARLRAILGERHMKVSAIASPVGKVDVTVPVEAEVARLKRAIAAAHLLESRYIRIFSFFRSPDVTVESTRDAVLERMSALAAEAEREGVVLVHENEKDIYGDTPDRVLDIIESVGSASLKVAWDNANFVQVGVKPFTDGYAQLRPHLEYLQVKDAIATTGEVVPAGEGDGQLHETIAALHDDGYAGFASLEPHLGSQHVLGGFSGPHEFGRAARAFAQLTSTIGVKIV
ncbi:sugar phosphate isomerase/epimerase family protein [Salinibacterium sp. PAMC 21357]|uniref:sugar phosphate isomerase/epimerase family protein n=1 Tax=Salinibacterium sp. PAMC 21357 TaxID=1112215 RepID=UPI000288B781|nr:sugar phosphate isomerase/epimerase family protein [Salinibacterium sp. PAMC 21357]